MRIMALPSNLDVVFTGRWSSRYVYGCNHPPETIEAENYFQPIANFLVDGNGGWRPDRIEVVLEDGEGFRTAEFVVCFASLREVRVRRVTDWASIGAVKSSTSKSAGSRKKAA